MIKKTKEIRPTQVWFETEKDFVEFISYVESTEKSQSEAGKRMRELMKKHRESKPQEIQ
ncbi:hypothetical protein [Paenibacillus sp. Marseille-Q4541]|uniref:hypothetical protein n=1 Tax=Paenibacillus sp. Marseille-Q4541 TaxID=2831522 RepID=UPI001BA843E9|nr:hypothetical protein [Paenibacillus sp. Marseille-Q4541]